MKVYIYTFQICVFTFQNGTLWGTPAITYYFKLYVHYLDDVSERCEGAGTKGVSGISSAGESN